MVAPIGQRAAVDRLVGVDPAQFIEAVDCVLSPTHWHTFEGGDRKNFFAAPCVCHTMSITSELLNCLPINWHVEVMLRYIRNWLYGRAGVCLCIHSSSMHISMSLLVSSQ